jgi:hypothetical protein
MPSPDVRKRLLLILIFVCGIAVSLTAYVVAKEQRDAAHLIKVLEQVQVGHTQIEDIAPSLHSARTAAASNDEGCEANSRHSKVSSPAETGGGGSPLPAGHLCGYDLVVMNRVLHGLRLAPVTGIVANVETNNGIVDQLLIFYQLGDFGNIGLVDFIQVAPGKATNCGRATCVERSYGSDGAVVKIRIQVAADAPSAERNRLLNFNTRCISKIGGCKNASELLPISEHD